MADEKILDKIRKLQAHAESASDIGNEAEAQAFASKVRELLDNYRLSAADIGGASPGQKVDEPIAMTEVRWEHLKLKTRNVRIPWVEQLAAMIAPSYYCRFLYTGRFGSIGYFAGTTTDREIALHMFITLGRFLYKLAEQAYAAEWKRCEELGDVTQCRGFKAGFMVGFLSRLNKRFEDEIRKPNNNVSTSTAIVLIRRDQLERVSSWIKNNVTTKTGRNVSLNTGNANGRAAGTKAANDLNLKPNAIGGTNASDRKQIR